MLLRIAILASFLAWHVHAFSAPVKPSTSPSTSSSAQDLDDILEQMHQIHETEVSGGIETFRKPAATTTPWTNDDFILRTDVLGGSIYETKDAVVTPDECNAIVAEARQVIAEGLLKDEPTDDTRSTSISNSQLGESRLSSMPEARAWLQDSLAERFLPLLEELFGVEASKLTLYDGLILGSKAPSRAQPIHRDASLFTINVALSAPSDYVGGGTYMEALDETLVIERGHLLCHEGALMHAGVGINQGERWVLVLFVLGEEQAQIARRCHAEALLCFQDNKLDEAEELLQTGLTVAPDDHLLHFTMGRIHVTRQDYNKAMKSFEKADDSYPVDPKALISTAQILVDRRRFRAALRRFDRLLVERIKDRDLNPNAMRSLQSLSWAARKDAARCCLMCCEYMASKGKYEWIGQHLPTAVERIQTCLGPAPQDTMLLGMLGRAQELLEQAKSE